MKRIIAYSIIALLQASVALAQASVSLAQPPVSYAQNPFEAEASDAGEV